ncbi:hypothetical protein SLS57_004442 [Botryosphaeria dothidea]
MSLPPILHLPVELLSQITACLPNSSIKSLRLTCRFLSNACPFRLSRIFLSPHPTNISVFLEIAAHPTLRTRIKEIIWDDALLLPYISANHYANEYAFDHASCPDPLRSDDPAFAARRASLWGSATTPPMNAMTALNVYRTSYLAPQAAVIATDADVAALRTGLRAFPNLSRVAVTADAWGPCWLAPKHETPLFRAMSQGFWMPLPRAWHGDVVERHRRNASVGMAVAGDQWDWEMHLARPWDQERACFRGYRVLIGELLALHAEKPSHAVREFVVDVGRACNGLHHALFAAPHESAGDFLVGVRLFASVPLTRLDLAINAYCAQAMYHGAVPSPWHCFGPDLRRALEGLGGALRHFALASTFVSAQDRDASYLTEELPAVLDEWLPVERWPHLESLGLARLVVDTDALLRLLGALPAGSIKKVELDTLAPSTSMWDLMWRLRREVVRADGGGWTEEHPRVVFMEEMPQPTSFPGIPRRLSALVDEEVNDFLYQDSAEEDAGKGVPCPFDTDRRPVGISDGVWYVVDAYDPDWRVPDRI